MFKLAHDVIQIELSFSIRVLIKFSSYRKSSPNVFKQASMFVLRTIVEIFWFRPLVVISRCLEQKNGEI